MSYDLAVWEGPAPLSNAHAGSEYDRRLAAPEFGPTSPTIQAFIDDLLERYPEHDPGLPGPWDAGPLSEGAAGTMLYFTVDSARLGEVCPVVEDAAARRLLVAFDPQNGEMLPSAVSVDRTTDFDLPASEETPLHLAAVIGEALDSGVTMAGIVEHVVDGFYVQWMTKEGGLTVEAQGDKVLPPQLQLDAAGRDQMMSLGFVSSDPNWSLHWEDGDGQIEQAARVLADVLSTVRSIPVGSAMKLQTFPV